MNEVMIYLLYWTAIIIGGIAITDFIKKLWSIKGMRATIPAYVFVGAATMGIEQFLVWTVGISSNSLLFGLIYLTTSLTLSLIHHSILTDDDATLIRECKKTLE